MENMNGAGPYGDSGSTSVSKMVQKLSQRYRYFLDKTTPHTTGRWLALLALLVIYGVRVYLLKGFYIVTYALGIFNLNLLLGFLTPQVDPELEGPTLPSRKEDEFRPFVRRLPEFKFWCGAHLLPNIKKYSWTIKRYSSFKAQLLGFVVTFFPVFDVPVFWPILLMYWLVLFFVTMKRQIKHMIKYRYIPFSLGKKSYSKGGGKAGKSDK